MSETEKNDKEHSSQKPAYINDILPQPSIGVLRRRHKEYSGISTSRPVELMFMATGREPKDFAFKNILNIGSGTSHWGHELVSRYGILTKKFENFDIMHAARNPIRRRLGELFGAEVSGDINNKLPYKNNSMDYIWQSVVPGMNISEYIRVLKPGGEVFVVPFAFGGGHAQQSVQQLSNTYPEASFSSRQITSQDVERHITNVAQGAYRDQLENMFKGEQVLIITKPKMSS